MNPTPQDLVEAYIPNAVAEFKGKFLEEYTRQPTAVEIVRWYEESKNKQEELTCARCTILSIPCSSESDTTVACKQCEENTSAAFCTRISIERATRMKRMFNLDTATYESLARVHAGIQEKGPHPAASNMLSRAPSSSEPLRSTSSSSSPTASDRERSAQAPPPPDAQPSTSPITPTFIPETSASAPTTSANDGNTGSQENKKPRRRQSQGQQRTSPKKRPGSSMTDRIKKLESQLQAADKLTEDGKAALEQARAELEDAKTQKVDYEAKFEEEMARNTELYQQLEALRRENADKTRTSKRLEEQVKGWEIDKQKLRECEDKVKELEAAVEKGKGELRRTKKRLEDRQKEVSVELERSNRERDIMKVELEKCKGEKDTVKAELDRETAEHAKSRQNLEEGYKAVQEAVEVYTADASRWRNENETLKTANNDQEATIRELMDNAKSRDDEITRLNQSIETLKGDNEEIHRSQTELQQKAIISDADAEKLNGELKCSKAELNKVKIALSEEQKNAEQNARTTRYAQAKMNEKNSQLDITRAKVDGLVSDLANVTNKYAEGKGSRKAVLDMCDRLGPCLIVVSEDIEQAKSSLSMNAGSPNRPSQAESNAPSRASSFKPSPSVSARHTDPLQLKPTTAPVRSTEASEAHSSSKSKPMFPTFIRKAFTPPVASTNSFEKPPTSSSSEPAPSGSNGTSAAALVPSRGSPEPPVSLSKPTSSNPARKPSTTPVPPMKASGEQPTSSSSLPKLTSASAPISSTTALTATKASGQPTTSSSSSLPKATFSTFGPRPSTSSLPISKPASSASARQTKSTPSRPKPSSSFSSRSQSRATKDREFDVVPSSDIEEGMDVVPERPASKSRRSALSKKRAIRSPEGSESDSESEPKPEPLAPAKRKTPPT
ncbi:hypothetical protein V5O48_015712, partial [Marasmius crinis-equi]